MNHAEVREMIASYALGALEPDDMSLVRTHLGECGFCANLAREATDVAHYLPYGTAYRPAPPGSLERLLARIQATPAGRAAPSADPARPLPSGGLRRWLENLASGLRRPAFTPVAAALLILGLAGWNLGLMRELKQERYQMDVMHGRLNQQSHLLVMVSSGSSVSKPLRGTPMAPSAEVRLIMDTQANTAMLMASHLPPLPRGQVYQVWLGRQGARMPAGKLVVDDLGDGECTLQLDAGVHTYDSAWITMEPEHGGPTPNSPGYAQGQLQ